jgi:hypothetical protein
MGILSPSHRSWFDVSETGDGPVALALAMGKAPASEQVPYLDRRSIRHRLGRSSWCIAVLASSNAQRLRSAEVWLVNPTEIPIRRYVKVKSDANPFDLLWRGYFKTRKRFK